MKDNLMRKIDDLHNGSRKGLIVGLFGIAFILRFIIAATTEGYINDLALFYYWANHLVEHGVSTFYSLDIFVDYPPGYMYVLYVVGLVFKLIAVEQGSIAYLLILKLPNILADILAAILIYRMGSKQFNFKIAFSLTALFLFNPWLIISGSVWGQIDIYLALMLVLCFLYLNKDKPLPASIIYGISLLIKPQTLIFAPIILVYFFYKRSLKTLIIFGIGFLASFLLLAAPFIYRIGGLSILLNKYSETIQSYPYASLNTFNLYSLLGLNWVSTTDNLLTIPIALISNIAIALTVILVFYLFIKLQKTKATYFYLAAVTISFVYLFVAKMHERYIFPILLFLVFAYIYEKNKHYLYILIGYSITVSINLIAVLDKQQTQIYIPYDTLLVCCSIVNICLFIYLLIIGVHNFKPLKANIKSLELANSQIDRHAQNAFLDQLKLNRLSVFAVLLVYSIIAVYQLGSYKAPETSWIPQQTNEYIVLDLGEQKEVNRIVAFYGAEHTGKLTFSTYEDDVWKEQLVVEHKHTDTLTHQVYDVNLNSQYIMLHLDKPKTSIHELAFFDSTNSEVPLPVSINSSSDTASDISKAEHLIDEQSLMKYSPSFLDSAYFDEIYHARTAFEYKLGVPIYETTHPPLGKLLILIGIQLVGFSPFGWRIVGTIVGVLVLYVIYNFARLLFEKHTYALTAMILFAVDFMHFTQSRLATIDIYIVLFTMLMFYFMALYCKSNLYKMAYWKSLVPLALSGLCFGLTISTKWNGFYGGVGLACMLLVIVIKQYIDSRELQRLHGYEAFISLNKASQVGFKRFLIGTVKPNQYWMALGFTLLSCTIFFVVVPASIYYSVFYIGATLTGESVSLSSFLTVQKNMYDYHSQLVATHPFSSPWYEWQLNARPIWYYVNNQLASLGQASTIAAFGNPIIWWFSIVSMLFTIGWAIYKKHFIIFIIFIGYLSQLLPWVFVDRITFIYHFFSMVPFIILSIVYMFQQIEQKYMWVSKVRWMFVIVAAVLFLLFYPVLSGSQIERVFIDDALRWFKSWYF